MSWIGVDLDGTLAHYTEWKGIEDIGPIVESMKARVLEWLDKGLEVRIFTARWHNGPEQIKIIQDWLEANGLPRLEVTATKDFATIEIWDDRCVQIEINTGKILGQPREIEV